MSASIEAIDIMEILSLLPHRYPFLMVDRIIDINGDESCTGIKNVSINEPHFLGHFPHQPVMPGVLLVEAFAQTAGALCVKNSGRDGAPPVVYFMSIEKAKFRRPVVPGDQVLLKMTKLKNRGSIWKYQGIAEVDGNVVAEAIVSAMMDAK